MVDKGIGFETKIEEMVVETTTGADAATAVAATADAATSTLGRLPTRTYNLTIGEDVDIDFPDFPARRFKDISLSKYEYDDDGNYERKSFQPKFRCRFRFCSNLRFNRGSNLSLVMTVTNVSLANAGNYYIQVVVVAVIYRFIAIISQIIPVIIPQG